jgi:hypothetical protein
VPVVLAVMLAMTAVLLIVIGTSLHGRATSVRSQRTRLVAASERVDARARREQRSASRVDNATIGLVTALTKMAGSQHAQVATQDALATAADAGIDQINNGDLTGGSNAFRTTVTAAADKNDIALAAARADLDSAVPKLAALDRATQAKP